MLLRLPSDEDEWEEAAPGPAPKQPAPRGSAVMASWHAGRPAPSPKAALAVGSLGPGLSAAWLRAPPICMPLCPFLQSKPPFALTHRGCRKGGLGCS